MANRLKKNVPPPPDPEKLQPDKEVDISVSEVVKDERTTKIAGAVALLFAFFLFIAFTSYLFTWQDDQDKVQQFGIKIFSLEDVKINNLLGVSGAYMAHFFMYKGFGIAAYLLCTFFFVIGVNGLFSKKVFSIQRNLRYVLVGLLIISVAAAFITPNSQFSWGGAVGNMLDSWFIKWMGKLGTAAFLLIAVFAYVIWRFNPVFKLPKWPQRISKNNRNVSQPITSNEATTLSADEIPVYQQWDAENKQIEEVPLEVYPATDEAWVTANKLKNGGKNVTVIMPDESAMMDASNPLIRFELQEKQQGIALEKSELIADESVDVMHKHTELDTATEPEAVIQNNTIHEHASVSMQPKLMIDDSVDMQLEIKPASEEVAFVAAKKALPVLDEPYDATLELRNYKFPTLDLLDLHGSEKIVHDPNELEANKNQIIATLKNYDIAIQRIAATVGPTVTLYEIVPAPGVRISRIKNLEDDIALSLAALGIRIIAPIPGKGTIGIEVPNIRKTVVSMRTLISSDKFQKNNFSLPIAIGKKIDNENFIVDLASMPHLLMAGATGQGKSVGLNAILVSLLYKKHPSQLKFILVDPKKVELSLYRVIEKHFLAKLPGEEEAIITDTKKVVNTLNALCIEMDNRYDLLKEAGVRNIKEYNQKFTERKLNPQKGHQYLPFIVLVVDEFADLIMTAGKEVEMPIARLAQLARAIGIHLIIATQRPSVNIITGTIKANFPARIAFKVSSKIDSRTILDAGGAEQLIGKGDMLINYNGEIVRLQCAFVDTPEVDKVCNFIGEQRGYPEAFLLPEYVDEKDMEGREMDVTDRDPLFEDAARLIVQNQVGSTSLIQRRMKLGYNRAGRLMDQLEAAGIVGPNLGSKAREVRFKTESELEEYLHSIP
ncbi:MAG: DNA translocase FtsK [Hydrotalea flava]|uniref:FtsK/SpoIIIE family DNA translocase n=1 Tax=Hydrotalea TaxID=1004300 RepID=UPI000942E61A|nr:MULTISPECIES: DNA translocase FtsK [Hydrotalea]MBY0347758.1 DNA translocase FtsK [Hydrotalea flava]RWZ87024.1 MAG: DNA translocase FtsK [Hydrotalea sp. AMD]